VSGAMTSTLGDDTPFNLSSFLDKDKDTSTVPESDSTIDVLNS
jgi:hypothetical protein